MTTQKKLKLLIFGATRNTGLHAMNQALQAGHEVTVIVRDPATFFYRHPLLTIVKGDALQPHTFENEVSGKDAIISSLGSPNYKDPTILCSQGVRNMLDAMQRADVRRIISISAIALDTNPKMGLFISTAAKVLDKFIFTEPYRDLRAMEQELKHSSVDWTIMRPPGLNDKPLTTRYRVAVGEHLSRPFSISREDLAHYIVGHILDTATYGKTVELAY